MLVEIICDQSYPVYGFIRVKGKLPNKNPDIKDVPEEILERWEKIESLYCEMQHEIEHYGEENIICKKLF